MSEDFGITITGIILAAIGFVLAISILIFNIKFMKLRFIKMTSPKVNVILVIGSILLYLSSLLVATPSYNMSLDSQSKIIQSYYWLVTFGFTGTFGSMLVKGWRVHRLFQYPRVHTVAIKDGPLFAAIFIMLGLDLVFLLCWQFLDPLTCYQPEVPLNMVSASSNTYIICSCKHYPIWMMVILAYKQLLILFCCYVGWQIRHITFAALDDSRCLLLGSFITFVLVTVYLFVMVLFPNKSLAHSFVFGSFLWLGTTAIMTTIFLPKMIAICKSHGLEPLMCTTSKYMPQPTSDDIGTELVKLLGENRYLKRKLEERETLLSHLRRQVSSSINADSDSHQTTSVNYSVESTVTSKVSSILSHFKLCVISCCDSESSSVKAKQGTPASDRDLTLNAVSELSCQSCTNAGAKMYGAVEEYPITASIKPILVSTSTNTNDFVQLSDIECQEGTSDIIPEELNRVTNNSNQVAVRDSIIPVEDLDLICSIADTYDLGGDSDTFSYISNCLYSSTTNGGRGNTMSLQRQKNITKISVGQSATLGSDQLYPDSVTSSLKPASRHSAQNKKHKRRISMATTTNITNIYVNDRGKPLIL